MVRVTVKFPSSAGAKLVGQARTVMSACPIPVACTALATNLTNATANPGGMDPSATRL